MSKEALIRFSNAVSVRDIMVETPQLRRADTLEAARNLFHEFDVVPYPRKGPIEGFFKRESDRVSPVEIDNVISADTSILSLPGLLLRSTFYFVVSMNSITGYVHYSDLNKAITKIPSFMLFQTAERTLWEGVESRIAEKDLEKVFGEEGKAFIKKREKAAQGNVDLGWIGIFTFPRILRLARYYGYIDLTDDEIDLLRITRNSIAHSDHLLVTRYEDIASLADAYKLIRGIVDR